MYRGTSLLEKKYRCTYDIVEIDEQHHIQVNLSGNLFPPRDYRDFDAS